MDWIPRNWSIKFKWDQTNAKQPRWESLWEKISCYVVVCENTNDGNTRSNNRVRQHTHTPTETFEEAREKFGRSNGRQMCFLFVLLTKVNQNCPRGKIRDCVPTTHQYHGVRTLGLSRSVRACVTLCFQRLYIFVYLIATIKFLAVTTTNEARCGTILSSMLWFCVCCWCSLFGKEGASEMRIWMRTRANLLSVEGTKKTIYNGILSHH